MPPTAPVRVSRMHRTRRLAAATVIGTLTCAAAAVLVAAAPAGARASARYVAGHDPFGAVTGVKSVSNGLRVTGWAADPDARAHNAVVFGVLDGRRHSGVATTRRSACAHDGSTVPAATHTSSWRSRSSPLSCCEPYGTTSSPTGSPSPATVEVPNDVPPPAATASARG